MNTQNTNKLPLNSVALLNEVKPVTKSELAEIAREIYLQVEEGQINPLTLITKFKVIKEIIERVQPMILENTLIEAAKYRNQDYNNFKVEVRNSGNRLQYEDDPIYRELKQKLKDREELLKVAHKQAGTIIFDENGIEVPVVSILAGKENVYLTLK